MGNSHVVWSSTHAATRSSTVGPNLHEEEWQQEVGLSTGLQFSLYKRRRDAVKYYARRQKQQTNFWAFRRWMQHPTMTTVRITPTTPTAMLVVTPAHTCVHIYARTSDTDVLMCVLRNSPNHFTVWRLHLHRVRKKWDQWCFRYNFDKVQKISTISGTIHADMSINKKNYKKYHHCLYNTT